MQRHISIVNYLVFAFVLPTNPFLENKIKQTKEKSNTLVSFHMVLDEKHALK